jgi:non-ribosomal peptide synthetase component F
MLQAARAALLLHAGPCPDVDFAGPRLDLDQLPPAPPAPEPVGPAAPRRPDEPAYLFFTSGTTGRPKGIRGTHGGLAHFLAWQRATFALAPDDRIAQLTSLSFDVVLRDLFLALTSGAALCLPPPDLEPAHPWPWFAAAGVTRLHAVPALAALWLDRAAVPLPRLRTVFFAGEPLPAALVQRWRAVAGPGHEIINLYGPTETTLAKCWYRVPDPPPPGVQPVGQPLPEAEVFVLDEAGRPCADGVAGELVIRTPHRTLGYLDDAAGSRPRLRSESAHLRSRRPGLLHR